MTRRHVGGRCAERAGLLDAAAALAGRPDDGADQRVVPVLGTRALLRYRLDPAEHGRRRSAGLGAVVSPDALHLLLGLPVGVPVPLAALNSRERFGLSHTPAAAAAVAAGTVTRRAVRPLSVDLAVVATRDWRAGLELAGRFAPFCPRAMLLTRPPDDPAVRCAEADFWDIGVAAGGRGGVRVLVPPEPARPRHRITVGGWQFLEEVYRQVCWQLRTAAVPDRGR